MEVEDVIAHAVYDPQARRERYLKTRQLKGRQKATPRIGLGSRTVDANIPVASSDHGIKANLDATARQKASDARQISAIRGRLNALKAHLQTLLAEKKKQSTSSSSSSKSTPSKPSTATQTSAQKAAANKPKTAKQKQAAKESLKKAQATRAQQQKAAPNAKKTPSLSLDEQITRTRAVISDVETKLRTAIEQSRTQTASNGR